MTTVLLVHPGIYEDANPLAFPPWGALSVASALKRRGFSVDVADWNGQDVSVAVAHLARQGMPDVVGFTAKAGLAAVRMKSAIEILQSSGSSRPLIVVGGPLVSTFPDPNLELWRGVDALFLGDGEESLAHWLLEPRHSDAPRLIGPSESSEYRDFDGALWWSPLQQYVGSPELWPNFTTSTIHMTASRGCTRRCLFCYLNHHATLSRYRPPVAANLLSLLAAMSSQLDVGGFYFVDDCFIDARRSFVREFHACSAGAGHPFQFGFDVQLKDLEDVELMKTVKEFGARAVYVGIEAGAADVRRRLGKGSVATPIPEILERVRDLGIVVRASIGIGWPDETLADMKETLALIDRCPDLAFDAYKYLPLPRTPLAGRNDAAVLDPSDVVAFAGQDYSGRNRNYSSVDDADFEAVWSEMRLRETERLWRYMSGGPGVTGRA